MTHKKSIPLPIYKGGLSANTDIEKLIVLEWKIIDKLWELAKDAEYDKHRGVYYQNLSSHARTLALLLKLTGATEQTEDLAKLLAQIAKKTKKFVKDMHGRGIAKT